MIAALFALVVLTGVLAYLRLNALIWTAALAAYTLALTLIYQSQFCIIFLWSLFAVFVVLVHVPLIRRVLFSNRILALFRKILPPMSRTEKEALEAGTVWWDGDLFSGKPNWQKLLDHQTAKLNTEELAFLDGPVNELCSKLDDWQISQKLNDLPPEVWQYVKDQGFLGMIIPKKYGGLEFSALAHSAVVMKISTRSVAAAVTVMVPNSLGPAELLLRYGTDAQKDHYLPRLAKGQEIPCFALTSPEAGSDASSIPDFGIVCKQTFEGKPDVLGIRVTWDKRYITLGPVATVLGLAFQLRDPDGLLGKTKELGITCALIPTSHPGVNIGRRHHPSGIGFQNGPNWGKDVFIPMDWVIGGVERVGQGWRMLMECLAAGRSISLPALSVGGAKFTSHTIGAYSRVRKQFKTPIGFFEGVEEPLARMAGFAYMMDSARVLTASALDHGESPSVLSAILKYNLTERMRRAVNDAMDIQGGAGICLGPHNILGKLYHAIPISITVEGANILTRSLIIFGQGAIRCHPYVLQEMQAAGNPDKAVATRQFDKAISGHIYFVLSNFFRSWFLGITNARFAMVPRKPRLEKYYRALTRLSSGFAFMVDVAMLMLGGALKRKEKLSGRFADILSLMYLASATLKRFEDQGANSEDIPLVQWACEQNIFEIQEAFYALFQNFPNRPVAWLLRKILFPFGRCYQPPDDALGHAVAKILLEHSPARERLTKGVYVPENLDQQVARLEEALGLSAEADKIEKRLYGLRKKGDIEGNNLDELLKQADRKVFITDQEAKLFARFLELKKEIIKVDDFEPTEFKLSD